MNSSIKLLNVARFSPSALFLLCFPSKNERKNWSKYLAIILALQAYLFLSLGLFSPYCPPILKLFFILILTPNWLDINKVRIPPQFLPLIYFIHGVSYYLSSVFFVINLILFILGFFYSFLYSGSLFGLLILALLTPLLLSPAYIYIQNSKIISTYPTHKSLPIGVGILFSFLVTIYYFQI